MVKIKTIREMVEKLAYSHYDKLTEIVYREGEKAQLLGYPACADSSGFTAAALCQAATKMYVHAKQTNSEKTEEYKKRMLFCFDSIKDGEYVGTWGKLFLLKALLLLKKNGEFDVISQKKIAQIEKQTEYTDFVNKETVELKKGLPTNYYHVAMECSGLRELLGFEDEGMSDIFAKKMFDIMTENSTTGWMDEHPPYGRFDSYSVGMNLTMCTALTELGKEVPKFLNENVKRVVDLYFAGRNLKGNGFAYGRSLSMYGESGVASHLVYALKTRLLDENQIDEAVAYIIHCVEKLTTFWYREDEGICDIWLQGRATEGYRGIHRIFEVNIEFAGGLLSILSGLEGTPYADYIPPQDIQMSQEWECHRTDFIEEEEKKRALFVLRRKDHTFMLPFIGLGARYKSASYMPIPHEPMFIEGPPADVTLPFLTPEVILDNGTCVMPTQHYCEITHKEGKDFVEITAKGKLTRLMDIYPDKISEYGFCTTYTFCKDKIAIEYNIERGMLSKILFASKDVSYVNFPDADRIEIIDTSENPDFNAPNGALTECKIAFVSGNKVRCEINL